MRIKVNPVGDLPELTQSDLIAGFSGSSRTSEGATAVAGNTLSPEMKNFIDSVHLAQRNTSFSGNRPDNGAQLYQMYKIQKEAQPETSKRRYSTAYGFNHHAINDNERYDVEVKS